VADDIRVCFRCKGLAVIDKGVLIYLPGILNRAANLLNLLEQEHGMADGEETTIDRDEVYNLQVALRQYAILLGGLPDGD
jgi:hypothetical protein